MNPTNAPLAAPPPATLQPERLIALLEHMGAPGADEELLANVLKRVNEVRAVRSWFPTWQVGAHKITQHNERTKLSARHMNCSCRSPRRPTCGHIGALLVVLAWADPDHRPLFTEPPWALQLLPLVEAGDVAGTRKPAASHKGWIRYHVVPPESSDWVVGELMVERQIVRLSRGGDKELKPQRCPDSIDKVEEKIRGVTRADRAFADAWEQLRELERLIRRGRPTNATERIRSRLREKLLAALCDVRELRYLGQPIKASLTPWRPALKAGERMDGGLHLRWSEPLMARWEWGPGLVLTDALQLRPLAWGVDEALLDATERSPPEIPPADVGAFVERFAMAGGVRVDLSDVRAGIADPDSVEGRLMLTEVGELLEVSARFGYRVGNAVVEVDPEEEGPLTRSGDAYVRRDRALESSRLSTLEAALGGRPPLSLEGERAMDFLLDRLPQLPEGWAIFGDRALSKLRVGGTVNASVSVPTGLDWFDMEIQFLAEQQGKNKKKRGEASASNVLNSWLEGRRYVRLKSGAWGRLPMAWMERHGRALADLLDMKKAGGRLDAHALPVAAGMLEEAGAFPDRWRALSKKLQDFSGVTARETPAVNAELRDYQRRGVDWLLFLRDHGLSGCLADDMGLGKTLQALAALAHTHRDPKAPPSLVVAPTSVVYNWAREAARFTPDLKVVVHHGSGRDAARIDDADVVVTSYALLRIDERVLHAMRWSWVILDEAQAIKNPISQVSRVARSLNAANRLALTGTPMENDLVELWSLFQFLMPGFFGPRAAFQRRYGVPIRKHQDRAALNELRARVRPFLLRRLKSEVASELPERQEVVLWCELGEQQRALYEGVRETYRESVLSPKDDGGRHKLHVLEALTRLRQACCHPGLLPFAEARAVPNAAKVDALMTALETAIPDGHRSLIFSQWPSFLKRIRERLSDRGWEHLYLDGGTQKRGALVDRWNDPDGPPVFLVSLKAGGSGLNLTGADYVFHMDPWWNPAVEDQATDRAHRIGQTRPVVAYKLVARGTVEEKILELQARKRAVFQATIDEGRMAVSTLTRDDLEVVFGERAAVLDR